jgi:hypothetical protein
MAQASACASKRGLYLMLTICETCYSYEALLVLNNPISMVVDLFKAQADACAMNSFLIQGRNLMILYYGDGLFVAT